MSESPAANPPNIITPSLSIYLDLVRFLAAFAVLGAHLEIDGLHASWVPLSSMSHEAVMVFFVLSGLVIATTVQRRETDWRSYTVARAVRMYSVVLPAIVLSFAVTAIAGALDPTIWNTEPGQDFSLWGAVSSIAFLNESWRIDTNLPWNHPFWSLCYEVWYYVLFGVFCFARVRSRLLWLAGCAVIAGPAIVALLPIWMLGAWMARWRRFPAMTPVVAWSVVIGSWTLVWLISVSGLDIALRSYLHDEVPSFWRLESSQRLITDYLLGILVALNFLAFRALPDAATTWLVRAKRPIRYFAGFTFSLYLFHRPLTKFCGHFWPNPDGDVLHTIVVLVSVLASCMLIGGLTESKKYVIRDWLRRHRWFAPRPSTGV